MANVMSAVAAPFGGKREAAKFSGGYKSKAVIIFMLQLSNLGVILTYALFTFTKIVSLIPLLTSEVLCPRFLPHQGLCDGPEI